MVGEDFFSAARVVAECDIGVAPDDECGTVGEVGEVTPEGGEKIAATGDLARKDGRPNTSLTGV